MVFGLSYGELAVIMVAGVAVFGGKDLPIYARTAGRTVGRAVGYLQSARGKVSMLTDRPQITELHKELQDTMAQLEAIRHELRAGVSLVRPGPLTRAVLREAGGGGGTVARAAAGGVAPGTAAAAAAALRIPRPTRPEAAEVAAGAGSSSRAAPLPDPSLGAAAQELSHPDGGAGGADSEALPISAVSAGLLPKRPDSGSGGADILADAIVERRVAHEALRHLRQYAPPPSGS